MAGPSGASLYGIGCVTIASLPPAHRSAQPRKWLKILICEAMRTHADLRTKRSK
jgi:hypothetical protein